MPPFVVDTVFVRVRGGPYAGKFQIWPWPLAQIVTVNEEDSFGAYKLTHLDDNPFIRGAIYEWIQLYNPCDD